MSVHKIVFRDQIWSFFQNDLVSCLNVSRIKQILQLKDGSECFPGGLNFSAALVIFCIIEMLAAYFKGITTDPKGFVKNATNDEVAEFMCKYFSRHDPLFSDCERAKQFYIVFRHGLVHQWSPKGGGVAMDFKLGSVYGLTPDGIMCLNVPAFYNLTIKAIKDYENDLDRGNYVTEFETRYQIIVLKDGQEMNELKQLL